MIVIFQKDVSDLQKKLSDSIEAYEKAKKELVDAKITYESIFQDKAKSYLDELFKSHRFHASVDSVASAVINAFDGVKRDPSDWYSEPSIYDYNRSKILQEYGLAVEKVIEMMAAKSLEKESVIDTLVDRILKKQLIK